MTTLTEEESLRLWDRLKQEMVTAISQSQWQRLGNLSEALKLLNQRSAATDLDVLTRQMEGLVGAELVLGALETAPTPRTAEIVTQGEREQSLLPEPSASTEVLAVLPSSEPAPAEGGTAALFPIDPTLQARLQSLLQELRTWRDQEPQDVIGLPTYLGRLRRLAGEIMSLTPRSAEAVRATGDVALLQEMQTLFSEVQSTYQAVRAAKERLDLKKAKEARVRASGLLKRAQDERYHQVFPSLAYGVHQAAEGLESEAETARQHIGTELRVYLSRQQWDEREKLVSQLDDLEYLIRKGVHLVPIDPHGYPDVVTPERTDLETIQVYADYWQRLLRVCADTAERLATEVEYHCFHDDLDRAWERCHTGLELLQTNHVKGDPTFIGVTAKLQLLLEEIDKRKKRCEAATVWFERAMCAADPILALNALAQAATIDPRLCGLEEQRTRWLAVWRRHLQQILASVEGRVEVLVREQKYVEALEALDQGRGELSRSPADPELELSELEHSFDGMQQRIQDEHTAWLTNHTETDRGLR